MINCFGLFSTLVLFIFFQKISKHNKFIGKIPIIVSVGVSLILILKIFKIEYITYNQSAKWLSFMIAPATIALSYPLYKNADLLFKNKRILYFGLFFGVVFAFISTYLCAKLFGAQNEIILSLLPKSTTMPIAVEISKTLDGYVELTACTVVLAGVFGGIFGHKILKALKIKSDIATGLAIGAASHVIGTAACAKRKKFKQTAASTIALILSGIFSVILATVLKGYLK